MFRPSYIIVHHSLTQDGQVVDTTAIREYHINIKGYRDIGYNCTVEKIKDEYEALYGRPLTEAGAHTIGYNQRSLGVCVIGNFELAPPTEEQLKVLISRVLKPWMQIFNIPVKNVLGHREVQKNRTCPGKFFNLDDLRKRL